MKKWNFFIITTTLFILPISSYSRIYDSKVGRFLQQDPIGIAGGVNRYAYVDNNPVLYTDPTGLDRRICTRKIRNTPGRFGKIRHDLVEFRDSKGNITIKSFGPNGLITDENANDANLSCPNYTASSDKADKAAQDFADTLADLVDYNLVSFNCQDFSQDVYDFQKGK